MAEVHRLARTSAPRAISRLLEHVEDKQNPAVSVKACELVLHYGVGKPRETPSSLSDFSNEELLAEVSKRERESRVSARASDSTMDAGAPDT